MKSSAAAAVFLSAFLLLMVASEFNVMAQDAVLYVPWPAEVGDCEPNICHFLLCPGGAGNFVTQAYCTTLDGQPVCACDYTPPPSHFP